MCRFYGLSIDELDRLPALRYESLWKAIEIITSQELLYDMKAANFPNLDKNGKTKVVREVELKAFKSFSMPRQQVKGYNEVVANIAARMRSNG